VKKKQSEWEFFLNDVFFSNMVRKLSTITTIIGDSGAGKTWTALLTALNILEYYNHKEIALKHLEKWNCITGQDIKKNFLFCRKHNIRVMIIHETTLSFDSFNQRSKVVNDIMKTIVLARKTIDMQFLILAQQEGQIPARIKRARLRSLWCDRERNNKNHKQDRFFFDIFRCGYYTNWNDLNETKLFMKPGLTRNDEIIDRLYMKKPEKEDRKILNRLDLIDEQEKLKFFSNDKV